MHSTVVSIVCLILAAAASLGIVFNSLLVTYLLAASVALIGVPHGALDHWTGRRLLAGRFPTSWSLIFFPSYLALALAVVAGWSLSPVVVLVSFFVVSAWHFGLEDDCAKSNSVVINHLAAIAVGGMVIWIPILVHPARIESLLTLIIPGELTDAAAVAVSISRGLAVGLLPLALAAILRDLFNACGRRRALRNVSFALLFALADVLISFGVYFCGWHSIRGLRRLAREHNKSGRELIVATFPLSAGAIALAVGGMFFWSSGQVFPDAVSRTLFIGLSAIAVPHLLLHGPLTEFLKRSLSETDRATVGMEASS